MAKKAATAAKTTRINRASPVSVAELERYCRGLNDWPRSWMGWEKDVLPGAKLVAYFQPFLEYLVTCVELSPRTIQKHVDNLWVLGGEIIRDLNENPSLRKKNIEQILFDAIDDDGGPLIYGVSSEQQQRSFDSTCRKFHRFLGQPLR
jgi:hypothetical protein